eukprot:scaffold70269_cov15-Tisochrysis_lutea.AAC.1
MPKVKDSLLGVLPRVRLGTLATGVVVCWLPWARWGALLAESWRPPGAGVAGAACGAGVGRRMGTGRKVGKRWLKSERAIMRASYMCMERACVH